MSLKPFKHPTVFVGCPYEPTKQFARFKKALEQIPLEFIYADTAVKNQHVLERIRSGVLRSDYCLFDITGWNPNVTLEVGLSEGLNKGYYILFKPGRKKKRNPPADLHGKQRIDFRKFEGFTENCLEYMLNHYLVKSLTHPRYVFDKITGVDRMKKFIVAMRFIAHFKSSSTLHWDDLKRLSKPSYFRDNELREIVNVLRERKLIIGKSNGNLWRPGRSLYKKVTF